MTNTLRTLSSSEIVGLTIIGEARDEPIEGQVAVGCVLRNRFLSNPTKYKTYHDVCLESKQFSCWNSDDPNRALLVKLATDIFDHAPISDVYVRQCMFIAQGIVERVIADNTKGALHYMTIKLFQTNRPLWAKRVKDTIARGNQVFFNV